MNLTPVAQAHNTYVIPLKYHLLTRLYYFLLPLLLKYPLTIRKPPSKKGGALEI
jgi:hypothetical protein